MKHSAALLFLLIAASPLLAQRTNLLHSWYTIHATLDERSHTVDGQWQAICLNQSTDTLRELWLELWPNAFKNDRTAYSEQRLKSGNTDFYFSRPEQHGYINRLQITADGLPLNIGEASGSIDVAKVQLHQPLPPGATVVLASPFHLKLPYNFSGYGYSAGRIELRNWYPAIASFDGVRWHAAAYTGQPKATVSEYDVWLTLPRGLLVESNAQLQDSSVTDNSKTLHFAATAVNDLSCSATVPGYRLPSQQPSADSRLTNIIRQAAVHRLLPAAGYNLYDGLQLGIAAQNFLSPARAHWFAVPMFATASRTVTGLAGFSYRMRDSFAKTRVTVGLNASRFSTGSDRDSAGKKVFTGFFKVAPFVSLDLAQRDPQQVAYIEWKLYLIGENPYDYMKSERDSLYYPVHGKTALRYINQVSFVHRNRRALYPYDVSLQVQQASDFYRIDGDLRYFFNYPDGGGLHARVFASKFGFVGKGSTFNTFRYQPKLTAVRGDEDYTYGDAFIGRSAFDGLASRQIMQRDGDLKLRTDLFGNLQGRSDNWVASMNLRSTLPAAVVGPRFPLELFFDVGTYADAWKKGTEQPRFLYVAGVQLNVLKSLLTIYAPLLYSRPFRDSFKTVPDENGFFKKISFRIDANSFLQRHLHPSVAPDP